MRATAVPVFAYRALAGNGRATAGVVDADTRQAAWEALRARGVYPTDLDEQAAGRARREGRVPAVELAVVGRQLAVLVSGGVPAAEAVDAAAEAASHPTLLAALTRVRAAVREGRPLADALAASPHVFPALWIELVRAGEASGALGTVLARAAAHAERASALRARLRAALAYPAVLAAATGGVLVFLVGWVLPQMAELFAETRAPLPLATRALLGGAALARATWWLWLPAGVAAVTAAVAWARRPAGRARLEAGLVRLPVLGTLAARAALARALRTLATVLGSGVRLEHGLELAAAAAGNVVVAAALRAARDRTRDGAALASALAGDGLVPPAVVRLVAAGERSGRLGETLDHAADVLDAEVERGVATATALLEPALVVAMGLAVVVLVVAVLVPVLSLDPLGAAR